MTDELIKTAKTPEKQEPDEQDKIYYSIRKSIRKQPGYIVDWPLVDKAWATAKERHADTFRQSEDPYIVHPRAVMEELANLRCKSSVLAAALLHDTMEDCKLTFEDLRRDFSYEVAHIVSAVTKIKATELSTDPKFASMSPQEQHDFLDTLTDAKLIASPYQREAFLVRFADRAHNLATIKHCKTDKRLAKIASTRAFLIPAARRLGMRYFEVCLSDLCMRYELEDYRANESHTILAKRTALTRVSSNACARFDQALLSALEEQQVFSLPTFNPYARRRGTSRPGSGEMFTSPRRVLLPYELKPQLPPDGSFKRERLDLWEVVLTCQDSLSHEMASQFVRFHREKLKDKGLYLEYVGQDRQSLVFRLTDKLHNNYRIVLLPESSLEAYFLGHPTGEGLTMIHEQAPGDALRQQITVYSYTPEKGLREHKKCIPMQATALDFAFLINPALAFTVKGARIHNLREGRDPLFTETDYHYPLHTVINEGDVVWFDADYHRDPQEGTSVQHAKLNWLRYINTDWAKTCLIDHFKEKYAELEQE